MLLASNIVTFSTMTSDHRERNIYNGAKAPIGWRSYRLMFRRGCVLLSAFCLLAVTGCGASPESLFEQSLADMNKLADAYEADKSEAECKEISTRLKEVNEKIAKLSDDEKKRMAEKYRDELAKASMRLMAAMTKNMGKVLGDKLQGIQKGMQKGMPPLPVEFNFPTN